MRGKGLAYLTAAALALLLSSCLVNEDKPRSSPLADGDFIPGIPVLPDDWPSMQWPVDNPYSPEKAILGRRLFFEPKLSRSKDRACSWCHGPAAAFADVHGGRFSTGVGAGITTRNSPTLANLAFAPHFMWDGSKPSLEEQALGPLFAAHEMGMTGPEVVARVEADTALVRLYRQAYGEGSIELTGVTRALATYQRLLVSHRSPYDRWSAGDETALTPAAHRGMELFLSSRLACATCHNPPLFTDGGFRNIGLDSITVDLGRGGVTGIAGDEGHFKTPTLRNIEFSPPYMHDGRFRTLAEVIAHYNEGGSSHVNQDPRVRPLELTEAEAADLEAFLRSLTDSAFLATPGFIPE